MKLAVLCNESRLKALPELRDVLDDLYIEYKTWCSGPDSLYLGAWSSLERVLAYSSYVLCMPGYDDFDAGWLHYALGYQRGLTNRLCFWISPTQELSVPPWMARFSVIPGGAADVFDHFSSVEKAWTQEIRQVLARSTIEERNLESSSRTLSEMVQKGDRFVLGLFLDAP